MNTVHSSVTDTEMAATSRVLMIFCLHSACLDFFHKYPDGLKRAAEHEMNLSVKAKEDCDCTCCAFNGSFNVDAAHNGLTIKRLPIL